MSAFNWHSGELKRIALLPILHPPLADFRKKIEALSWSAEEVDLSKDGADWINMTTDQKHFVKMQLAFFATIDISVGDNINNLIKDVDCMEARMFYAAQLNQEYVHTEAYSLQIASIMDGEERTEVLNSALTMPIVTDIKNWATGWFNSELDIGERLIAFAVIEGVLFSASFSALQWLRELNILPGITNFNSFILRDEGIHTDFTCTIVKDYLKNKPSQERAQEIFIDAVVIIDNFVRVSLPVHLIGMNENSMKQYVRYRVDYVLQDMGYSSLYNAKNPFPFMEMVNLNKVAKTNFFESRPTQYQNISIAGQINLTIDDTIPNY